MNKRQYQIIALGIVLGSLLIVSIVSRMISTMLPGVPTGTDNVAQTVPANDGAPINQAQPDPAQTPPAPQGPPQSTMVDPAAPAFDPQPTLDTSGIPVSGSDAPSSEGAQSGGETPPASTTGGVDPAPAQ